MLKYFDDIIGKGLGIDVIGQLLFYFAIFMTPIAMPLAVLLSALIAFGNLGEHFELTAIKSAGISLVRTLVPIFFFVLMLTAFAFYVNNNLVPKAALEAYSLLYDIKQKKPALDLREGSFYDGIPNMNIKVNKKFPDGETIKGIIIYDHRKNDGNKDVTTADSGKMYTILNERYLKLELFNGYNHTEGASTEQEMAGRKKGGASSSTKTLSRTQFEKTQVVFDLASFQLARTDKKWFQGNRIMRNLSELESDIDSIDQDMLNARLLHYEGQRQFFSYLYTEKFIKLPPELLAYRTYLDSLELASHTVIPSIKPIEGVNTGDSSNSIKPKPALITKKLDTIDRPGFQLRAKKLKETTRIQKPVNQIVKKDSPKPVVADTIIAHAKLTFDEKIDSIFNHKVDKSLIDNAASRARSTKNQLMNAQANFKDFANDRTVFRIQWHKILASSMACIAMFLIGAPLGAIIKKGGLGVPFLVSILFFIIYYLLTMTGEKWAKQGIISVPVGVWTADILLLLVGLIFLRQARLDARLFEADFYSVLLDKLKKWLILKKILKSSAV